MYKALYLSPMIQSSNIRETVLFFQEVLDFRIGRDDQSYVILYKDNLTLHVKHVEHEPDGLEFYLEVDEIDRLWAGIGDRLAGIKVREPFNQDYGMRELHIAVPHTRTILFIGQELRK